MGMSRILFLSSFQKSCTHKNARISDCQRRLTTETGVETTTQTEAETTSSSTTTSTTEAHTTTQEVFHDVHPEQTNLYYDCLETSSSSQECSDAIHTIEAVAEYLWCSGLDEGSDPQEVADSLPEIYQTSLNLANEENRSGLSPDQVADDSSVCEQDWIDKCEAQFKGTFGLALAFPNPNFDPVVTYQQMSPICLGVLSMHRDVCSLEYCDGEGRFAHQNEADRCSIVENIGNILGLDVCANDDWVYY